MSSLSTISQRQTEILEEIAVIDRMRTGTISPNRKMRKKKNGEVATSTYYVLSCKDGNQRTVSENVRADRLGEYQVLVDNTRAFHKLVKEYEELANEKAKRLLAGESEDRAKKTANRSGKGN